jgi:hypothetical protein
MAGIFPPDWSISLTNAFFAGGPFETAKKARNHPIRYVQGQSSRARGGSKALQALVMARFFQDRSFYIFWSYLVPLSEQILTATVNPIHRPVRRRA